MSIPDFCLACGRQYAPLLPTVADRNRARHAAPDRPRVYPAVVAGAAWWLLIPGGLAALIVTAVDWLVGG